MNVMGHLQAIQRKLVGSYWDVVPLSELGLDVDYKPVFSAVEFRQSGTFSFVNIYNQTRTIEVDVGRVYPVHVKKVNSGSTTIPASDIYGYKEYFES